MSVPLAYLNGRFLAADQASLHVWDRGVVQAATVTEMIRTFRGIPFRLAAHLDRLRHSVDYLQVHLSESDAQFVQILEHLLQMNRASSTGDQGIVIFVTAGSIPLYAGICRSKPQPTVCVHTFPLPVADWAPKYQSGISLVVPAIRQIPSGILDPTIKYRSRMHWYLADQSAQRVDPAAVALLQNEKNFLTETNSGNFFIVQNGVILTPPSGETLAGISQAYIEELANQLAMPYHTANITLEQALSADEAFTTSTSYCILPVTRINQQAIGSGSPGPVTRALLRAWSDAVGVDIATQGSGELHSQQSP